jgi:hypothetical protein
MDERQPTDPLRLRWIARLVVLATLVVAGVAYVLSADRPDPDRIPGIALDSPFLLDLERAVVVSALLAALLMFAIRGWDGYFPSKLSTTGAEYADRNATDVSESATRLAQEVRELSDRQISSAEVMHMALERMTDDIETLRAERSGTTEGDDML